MEVLHLVMRQECILIFATNINEHFPISKVESSVNFMLRTRRNSFFLFDAVQLLQMLFLRDSMELQGLSNPHPKVFLK